MIAAIQLERYLAGAYILAIVICKLGYRQKLGLIILFKINKSSDVCFNSAVLPLRFAICLKVENGRKPPFDAKEITKL